MSEWYQQRGRGVLSLLLHFFFLLRQRTRLQRNLRCNNFRGDGVQTFRVKEGGEVTVEKTLRGRVAIAAITNL